jgi:hypothetical protein
MPICLTLPCKKCREEFLATFGEDEDSPEYCDSCRGESSDSEVIHTETLDSMSKLIVPDKDDLIY